MPIWQLCANLLIPNCLRSNLSYSPLAALELYVNNPNAMGYKSQIKSTTVDKAVECIINQSNNRVDEDNSLDEHQKQQIKKDNEIILRMCADITKNKLKETEQLIED